MSEAMAPNVIAVRRQKSNGELQENIEELKTSVENLGAKFDKLNQRFTLFFGLGIGAMAASGLIQKSAGDFLTSLLSALS